MDSCCTRSHLPLWGKDFERDVKAKKFYLPSSANTSEQLTQSGQTTAWPNKKNYCVYRGGNDPQQDNTLATEINTTLVKKDKKIEKDLSQMECYSYHKRDHYANKYPDKQP